MCDANRLRACALSGAIVLMALGATPALANEKPAGGGGCPWAQDVSLELGGKTLTVTQEAFSTKGEPMTVDGYQLYPAIDQLKLRIVGPRGQEWEAALTRLVGGKRCSAFYVGKPVQTSDSESDGNTLVLNR